MKRRRLLVGAGVGVGMALSGCIGQARDESGPRHPPGTPDGGRARGDDSRALVIREADVAEGDDGSLTLTVFVENTSGIRQSDTLVGIATVDDTEHRASQDVSLDAKSEDEVTLVFDVEFSEWSKGGGLDYGWDDEL